MEKNLTILGGGPIGVETAARAVEAERDYEITVLEAGSVGEHVRSWGHVRLFSPWELNRSRWGSRRLQNAGVTLADDGDYPTGDEYVADYLLPLAESLRDDVDFRLHTKVVGVSRDDVLKPEHVGGEKRREVPFLIRTDGLDGRGFEEADIVIDTTGVLAMPSPLGPGGLPAVGERRLNGAITRAIPDVDMRRGDFANQRTLVVGHGHSAMTTLDALNRLRDQAENTQVVWAFRTGAEPCTEIEDDPLPERARLDRFGNAASRGEIVGITPIPNATVRRIDETGDELTVTLDTAEGTQQVTVDHIVANVGYRPDISLYRELQVHLCYATDGPMSLAASLMAADAGANCLDQSSGGIETLTTPEPDFYVLGAKSYGRNPNFLLNVGFEQIDTLFEAGL